MDKAFETFHEGETVEGTIRSIVDFGMFVEIAPFVQGLVHISEISWDRSVKPADLYKVGDKVEVYIKGLTLKKAVLAFLLKRFRKILGRLLQRTSMSVTLLPVRFFASFPSVRLSN